VAHIYADDTHITTQKFFLSLCALNGLTTEEPILQSGLCQVLRMLTAMREHFGCLQISTLSINREISSMMLLKLLRMALGVFGRLQIWGP